MNEASPHAPNLRPHPLAKALAARLAPGARILEIAAGSGRNTSFLRARGFDVVAVPDREAETYRAVSPNFDAAISTHGLLHGSPQSIAHLVLEISRSLRSGTPLHCTLASKQDERYGKGEQISADVFAPIEGDEVGVPHVFFDAGGARSLFEKSFAIESLDEVGVDTIAGSWAHARGNAGSVHWFLRATRR